MPLSTQENQAMLDAILDAQAAEKTAQEAAKAVKSGNKTQSQEATEAAEVAADKYIEAGRPKKAEEIMAKDELRTNKEALKEAETGFDKKKYDAANKTFQEEMKAAKGDDTAETKARAKLDQAKEDTGYHKLGTAQSNVRDTEQKVKDATKARKVESTNAKITQPKEVTIALKANKEANETQNSRWSKVKAFIAHPVNQSRRKLSLKQMAENKYNKTQNDLNKEFGGNQPGQDQKGQDQGGQEKPKKKRSGATKVLMAGAAVLIGLALGGPILALILAALVLGADKLVEKVQNRDTQPSLPSNPKQQSDFKSLDERQQDQQQYRGYGQNTAPSTPSPSTNPPARGTQTTGTGAPSTATTLSTAAATGTGVTAPTVNTPTPPPAPPTPGTQTTGTGVTAPTVSTPTPPPAPPTPGTQTTGTGVTAPTVSTPTPPPAPPTPGTQTTGTGVTAPTVSTPTPPPAPPLPGTQTTGTGVTGVTAPTALRQGEQSFTVTTGPKAQQAITEILPVAVAQQATVIAAPTVTTSDSNTLAPSVLRRTSTNTNLHNPPVLGSQTATPAANSPEALTFTEKRAMFEAAANAKAGMKPVKSTETPSIPARSSAAVQDAKLLR